MKNFIINILIIFCTLRSWSHGGGYALETPEMPHHKVYSLLVSKHITSEQRLKISRASLSTEYLQNELLPTSFNNLHQALNIKMDSNEFNSVTPLRLQRDVQRGMQFIKHWLNKNEFSEKSLDVLIEDFMNEFGKSAPQVMENTIKVIQQRTDQFSAENLVTFTTEGSPFINSLFFDFSVLATYGKPQHLHNLIDLMESPFSIGSVKGVSSKVLKRLESVTQNTVTFSIDGSFSMAQLKYKTLEDFEMQLNRVIFAILDRNTEILKDGIMKISPELEKAAQLDHRIWRKLYSRYQIQQNKDSLSYIDFFKHIKASAVIENGLSIKSCQYFFTKNYSLLGLVLI